MGRLGVAMAVLVASYASGAAAQASDGATEPAAGAGVPVRVEASEPGMALHLRLGEEYQVRYERLCTAPCSVSLVPGAYRFGVARRGESIRTTSDPIHVREPTTLRVSYSDVRWKRALAAIGYILLVAGGTALLTMGLVPPGSDGVSIPMVSAGVAAFVGGNLLLIPMLRARSGARIRQVN